MWEQYVEFLKGLGLKPPVDLTDPRLSPDDLRNFLTEVKAKRSGMPLAEMRRLKAAADQIQAEVDTRVEVATLDADIDKIGAEPEAKAEDGKAENIDLEDGEKLSVADANTGDGTPTEDDEKAKELALAATAALAAGGATQNANDREGGVAADNRYRPMVAAATIGGAEMAHPIPFERLGEMVREALAGYKGHLRSPDQERRSHLASVLGYGDTAGFDDSRVLSMEKGASENTSIIRRALDDHVRAVKGAKTAAINDPPATGATFCPPWDVIREIPDATDTEAPFRGALPFVPFRHGGFTFNGGVGFADVAGAVDIWTEADQASVSADTSSTWKPCYEIVCGDVTTLRADDWITACVQWKVGTDLNNPERVADVFRKVEGQRVRRTEQYLMGMVDAFTTDYNFAEEISALPDFLTNVIKAFHHARYNQRLDPLTSYTMFLDTELLDVLMVDRERTAFGVGREQTSVLGYIRDELSDHVDRIVQVRDRNPGAFGTDAANGNPYTADPYPPAGGTVSAGPNLVTRYRIRIIPTGEVFAFGTGEIRTGIKQDFAMALQNKVGWFVEEAVKLGRFGTSPWFGLNMNLCPSGARVGWLTPAACTNVPTLPS